MAFIDVLQLFNEDPDTDGVFMIGEIGGGAEGDKIRVLAECGVAVSPSPTRMGETMLEVMRNR